MHREKRSLPIFLVVFELMVFLRNTIRDLEFVQMAWVIAEKRSMLGEVEKVTLVPLNDSYVLRLLTLLEQGEKHHFFDLVGISFVKGNRDQLQESGSKFT